jgi:hypothetical protein
MPIPDDFNWIVTRDLRLLTNRTDVDTERSSKALTGGGVENFLIKGRVTRDLNYESR